MDGGSYRILVVEPPLSNGHGLASALAHARELAASVDSATSGEDAMRLVEATAYHLVIADERVPDVSGSALLDRIRRLRPHAVRVLSAPSRDVGSALRGVEQSRAHYFVASGANPRELELLVIDALRSAGNQKI